MNLGINASHAMEDGGQLHFKTREITLDQSYCDTSIFEINPGNFIEIEVRDTGTGIPAKNLIKIFDPFYTTKEPGKGTGLGLSVTFGTIVDHNGAI